MIGNDQVRGSDKGSSKTLKEKEQAQRGSALVERSVSSWCMDHHALHGQDDVIRF